MLEDEDDLLLGEKLDKEKAEEERKSNTPVEYLKKVGALDFEIQSARELAEGFDPNKQDNFDDTLVYRAYYAAKKSKTATVGSIAKALNISTKLLKYYCQTYPKVGMAIQAGYMDAVDDMKESLVSKLYEAAMGQIVMNKSTNIHYITNQAGDLVESGRDVSIHEVSVAPNTAAQLELLKRLDPSWIPKMQVDINQEITHNFNVTEDVNIQVDYRKLSPSALQELLEAGRKGERDNTMYVKEAPVLKEIHEDTEEDKNVRKSRKSMHEPIKYGRRVNKILQDQEDSITEAKEIIKKEINKDGSTQRKRGRKKKDS